MEHEWSFWLSGVSKESYTHWSQRAHDFASPEVEQVVILMVALSGSRHENLLWMAQQASNLTAYPLSKFAQMTFTYLEEQKTLPQNFSHTGYSCDCCTGLPALGTRHEHTHPYSHHLALHPICCTGLPVLGTHHEHTPPYSHHLALHPICCTGPPVLGTRHEHTPPTAITLLCIPYAALVYLY